MTQPTIDGEVHEILKFMLQYAMNNQLGDGVFVSGTRPQEAVNAAHTKITNLIAQETNKALAEQLKWFLGMADIGHGVRRLAQDKLEVLTKEGQDD